MKPLLVTAHLQNGFASGDPWSPTIDGILAHALMRERHGHDYAVHQSDASLLQPVDDLPLEKINHGGWWWYAASIPITAEVTTHRQYYSRKFDQTEAERYVNFGKKRAKVETRMGPHKNTRLNDLVRITPYIYWHVVGDEAEVRRLVRTVGAVGRRVGSGNGKVISWDVNACGDAPTAYYYRPLPVDYAREHGIEGPMMRFGVRPPARADANKTVCVVPQ